jgi:DNA-binding response OmpR family regulator
MSLLAWLSGAIFMPGGEAPIVLVPERFAVQIQDQEVILTPTQFRVLSVLASHPGRLFSRAELMEHGIGSVTTERAVDAHVKALRQRLGPLGVRIETVRGFGYRYEPTLPQRPEQAGRG